MTTAPDFDMWLEVFVVLGVGAALIVLLAECASRGLRAATWRRTIWQISTLGLLALILFEVSGMASGVVQLSRTIWQPESSGVLSGERQSPPAADPENTARAHVDGAGEDRLLAEKRARLPAWNSPHDTTSDALVGIGEPLDWIDRPGGSKAGTSSIPLGRHRPETGDPSRDGDAKVRSREPARSSPRSADAPSGAPPGPIAREPSRSWRPGAIWALGSSLVGARLVCAGLLLALFRRRHRRLAEGPVCDRVRRLSEIMGIGWKISVRESPGLRTPMTFGLFRPAIVLPARFDSDFGTDEQDAVLAHELAHVAARDTAWQWLADLNCALAWWHPIVWWSRHRLHVESEFAADEASAVAENGPDILAECLVRIGVRMTRPLPGGLVSIQGRGFRSNLGRRVQRLVSGRDLSWKPQGRLAPSLFRVPGTVVLTGAALLCTAWARPQPLREGESEKGEQAMRLSIQRSWKRSLAGVLFIAAFHSSPHRTLAQAGGGGSSAGQSVRPETATEDPGPSRTVKEEKTEAGVLQALGLALPAESETGAQAQPGESTPPRGGGGGFRAKQRPGPSRAATPARRRGAPGLYPARVELGLGPRSGGSPISLDLVDLAVTLTETTGSVEISRLKVEKAMNAFRAGEGSREDVEIAQIEVRTAQRKVAVLRQVAEAALRSSETLVEHLLHERDTTRRLVEAGTVSLASLTKAERQVAQAKANVDILRAILGKPERKTSSADEKKISISLLPGDLILLNDTRIEPDALVAVLADVPPKDRSAVDVRVKIWAEVKAERLRSLFEAISKFGFSRIHVTERAAESAPEDEAPPQ